jgi:hypothetical protein
MGYECARYEELIREEDADHACKGGRWRGKNTGNFQCKCLCICMCKSLKLNQEARFEWISWFEAL